MDASRLRTLWDRLTRDLAFRVATVYAGSSWFLIEAADTLGASTGLVRTLALVLAIGFLVVVPGVWILERPRKGRLDRDALRLAAEGGDPAAAGVRAERGEAGATAASRGSTRSWLTALGLIVILAVGAWLAGGRLGATVPAAATHIAVVPFHATGSDAARELGQGMVDLLSAAMDDVAGIRTVSSRSVLARLDPAATGPLPVEDALALGRRLGAGSVLMGSVTAAAGRVRMHGEVVTVEGGEVLASADVEGEEGEVLAVADALAVDLLRQLWRSSTPLPDIQTAALTTRSPIALRAYLAGERHLRAMRVDSATHAFRTAVAADSTFALAWLRLSESTGWHGEQFAETQEQRLEYLEAARRHADRLPARARGLVNASYLAMEGDFAAFDSLDAYVARYPDDPYGWYLLGDTRFHSAVLGRFADSEIREPFLEAARLDPSFALGLVHSLDFALDQGDRAAFDTLLARYATAAPDDDVDSYHRQARVRWAPDDSVLTTFLAEARALDMGDLPELNQLIGVLGNRVRLDLDVDPLTYVVAMDSAGELFAGNRNARLRTTMLAGRNLVALGRAREGMDRIDDFLAMDPPGPPMPRELMRAFLRVSTAMEHRLPPDQVARDLELLAAEARESAEAADVLHFYYLSQGDTARAADFPVDLQPVIERFPEDSLALRLANEGWEHYFLGREDQAVRDLRAAARAFGFRKVGMMGFAMADYADLLSRSPETRQQGIRMLRWITIYSAIETGRGFLALARALEEEGLDGEAASAYAQVIRLWEGGDPHVQPHVTEARRALARLTGER